MVGFGFGLWPKLRCGLKGFYQRYQVKISGKKVLIFTVVGSGFTFRIWLWLRRIKRGATAAIQPLSWQAFPFPK